jgi:hypothetical protein
MINWGRFAKTIIAVVTGAIGWATLVVNSDAGSITANEWIVGATYLATALGVYAVPNAQPVGPTVPAVPDVDRI